MKKEFIIEVEEQTTQVETSTHKLEELVGGQQKKIDEDTNQKEGKCVLEQEKILTDVHKDRKDIPVLDKLNHVTIK